MASTLRTPIPTVTTAARMTRLGSFGDISFGEIPVRPVGPTDVLIRTSAAAINPVDTKTALGGGIAGMLDEQAIAAGLPLGWDIAGEVIAVGSDVDIFQDGDRVFGLVGFPAPAGTFAAVVTAPAAHLAKIPVNVTDIDAAASTLAALTAWQALVHTANIQPGQRVLVHGGAGGVGHFAVQIARARGAYVITTASAGHLEIARAIGANEVVDYRSAPFEDSVAPVDVILNPQGPEITRRSWSVLRPGGIQVTLLDTPEPPAGLRGQHVFVSPSGEDQTEIARLLESGTVRPYVSRTAPFRNLATLFTSLEAGHVAGKFVVTF